MSMLLPTRVALISLTVQRVYAVGEPPEDKICFFRGLKNVVVFPAVGVCLQVSCHVCLHRRLCLSGERSLASCLSGGNLDGYLYA